MPRLRVIFGSCIVVAALALVACTTDGQACPPGDYRYCTCPSARGYEQCRDDGTGYGACDCSGAIPLGAGILVEAGAPDAGRSDAASSLAGFLEPCTTDEQCSTNLCFAFNAYGPHCSQPCTKDLDCPPPSPGCSKMQICKLH